jgi:hypothetical protein
MLVYMALVGIKTVAVVVVLVLVEVWVRVTV